MSHDLSAILPHRAPMLLVSRLDDFSAEGARATVELRADNPFLRPDGLLERAAYSELMAQCFAAGAGALARRMGKSPTAWGYLAALRDIVIHADARCGEILSVSVKVVATLGQLAVVEGEVRSANYPAGTLLAAGQFKVFIPEEEDG